MRKVRNRNLVLVLGAGLLVLLSAGCSGEKPVAVALNEDLLTGRVEAPAVAASGSLHIGFDRRL
jgi:hypothetical protein